MTSEQPFHDTVRIDLSPEILRKIGELRIEKATPRRRRSVPVVTVPDESHAAAKPGPHHLLQNIYDGALITDLKGQVVDVNIRASELLLYSPEEFAGMHVMDTIIGADEKLIRTIQEYLPQKRFALIQAYCLRKDQSAFPAEIAVSAFEEGETNLCFLVRDVTLRRHAEEMLRTEHNAIQNAANGIAIADIEGRLQYTNPATVRLWGCKAPEDLIGRYVWTLLKDEESARAMVRSILNNQTWTGEMIAIRADGREAPIQVGATDTRNNEGDLAGMVFSFMDINDRKRAEEAMRQAEGQRAMLATVCTACHYLGQPITVITTNLEMMKRYESVAGEGFKLLLDSSIDAVNQTGEILYKLNTTNEYRTSPYIDPRGGSDSPDNRILDI